MPRRAREFARRFRRKDREVAQALRETSPESWRLLCYLAPGMAHTLTLTLRTEAALAVDTVTTHMRFHASPAEIWNGLMFYEQLDGRPPWYLRLLLPTPIRTEGRKSVVGDEAMCLYVGGYLRKRVSRIDEHRLYGFAVVDQKLDVGGIHLSDGEYALRALPDGGTEVSVVTRYTSTRRPRWLWRRLEAAVCHAFHRHILRAMRREIEA
jgi:hypothetical protein